MSFVIALPLLLVFLFAVVDMGRTVYLHMSLADAAYAACQAAVEPYASDVSSATIRDAAFAAAPALATSDLRLSIDVYREEAKEEPYTRRMYNTVTKAFEERLAYVKTQHLKVKLTLEGFYLTPLGRGLSAAQGVSDARFLYEAESSGVADSTVKGGLG